MVKRLITLLFITPLALWFSSPHAAQFNVSVDRSQLSIEEHLTLTFELINSDQRLRAEGQAPNIDLSLLGKDFALGTPAVENHYNIHRGRGRSTSSISVDLFPKHSGKLHIPSYEIDNIKSNAINIQVNPLPADTAPELFSRVGYQLPQPQTPGTTASLWQHQQLVVYVDLYHRVAIKTASLGDNLYTDPIRDNNIQTWKMPALERREQYKGYDYTVQRIAWSIFQHISGPLRVYPPDLWVETHDGRRQRLLSDELAFEVNALPADVPANIIIGQATLTARYDTSPLTAEQHQLSHTWQVTLSAPTGITMLPKALPLVDMPAGLKLYAEAAQYDTKKTNAGITDVGHYTLTVMPLKAGEFTLPTLKIPYFDPVSGTAALARLEGPILKVAPAALPERSELISPANQENNATTQATRNNIRPWPYATLFFALLWLGTLALWWRHRKQNITNKDAPAINKTASTTNNARPLETKLLNALQCTTLQQGLQKWQQHMPQEESVITLIRKLQQHYYSGPAGQQDEVQLTQETAAAINLINKTPLANTTNEDPWQPRAFTPTTAQR